MTEILPVSREFLQRALGAAEENDPLNVQVTLDAFPPDFPVDLSPLGGVRVLGGVRSVATGWTFAYAGGAQQHRPERRQWRVFLDVAQPLQNAFETLTVLLAAQGWRPAVVFQQVFVEAEQTGWLGVTTDPWRQAQVQLRSDGPVTQVWFTVSDLEEEHARHLLGEQHLPAGFGQWHEASLPVLMLPSGWKAQKMQGSTGPVTSLEFVLHCAEEQANAGWLLAHLAPQLDQQGWHLLHQEGLLTVYRTAQGVGVLNLKPQAGSVQVHLTHVTFEEGREANDVLTSPP